MKFQKSFKKRIVVFLYVCLFSMPLMYSQTPTDNQNMHKINYKYGERIELKRDENVTIGDTLSVTLKYFTHKMPYLNGPTKATAYLTVSKGTISEEILLSVIGTSVKSESKEQYEMVQEFSTVMWKGYVFKLEKLDYGTSIEIVVLKE